jgi:hypothetical protein
MVPVIKQGALEEFGKTVNELVQHVTGTSALASVTREGSVFRELCANQGQKGLSFKVINPNFLL